MMPVNMSVASLRGDGDADLDFHETFPAVMSEKRPKAHGVARPLGDVRSPSSFIRTVTVGSGIGPDLLTFRPKPEALAGSFPRGNLPPVGSFAPP
jgi:hypothetical protein